MCGLNTAIVAGGDVGPLGAAASSELSGLMRWARSAGGDCRMGFGGKRKGCGVALVMDEAEAALGDRCASGMSSRDVAGAKGFGVDRAVPLLLCRLEVPLLESKQHGLNDYPIDAGETVLTNQRRSRHTNLSALLFAAAVVPKRELRHRTTLVRGNTQRSRFFRIFDTGGEA